MGQADGQVHFIKRWLNLERPAGVALHAERSIDVDLAPDEAFALCVRGVEFALGGTIDQRDTALRHLEARFGLVNSERLAVSVEPRADGSGSRLRVQARRAAGMPATPSQYVEALCAYVIASAPK